MSKPLKPGQKAEHSGIYQIIGVRGGDTGEEVTVVKDETLPPTPRAGQTYKLVYKTS